MPKINRHTRTYAIGIHGIFRMSHKKTHTHEHHTQLVFCYTEQSKRAHRADRDGWMRVRGSLGDNHRVVIILGGCAHKMGLLAVGRQQ